MNVRALARLMLIGLLLPMPALAWWNDDWAYRKQIRFDLSPAGADTSETLANVPMLIRLSAGNFGYFGDAQPDGSDLRFIAADDVTPLPYYIERFDGTNQIALVWVQVPRLTAGANSDLVYMYYGNPDAAPASGSPAVHDAEAVLVYDFSQDAGGFRDRTGYGHDPSSSTADSAPLSLIAGGAEFTGTETVEIPAAPALAVLPQEGLTASAWVRPAEIPATDARLVSVVAEDGGSLVLGLRGPYAFLSVDFGDGAVEIVSDGLELAADQWVHLALRLQGTQAALLVNGEPVATGEIPDGELTGSWRLGDPDAGFVGQMDHFRIASTARPDAWLRVIARTEAPFSTVVFYGEDAAQEGGGGESYLAITLRNVTIDGWVVIAILAVMTVISWVVMVMKSMLLSRVQRQNNRFLAEYRRLTGDPLALDRDAPELDSLEEESVLSAAMEDATGFHPSTLFPLYHVGAAEVRKRVGQLSPGVGAAQSGLSAKSIGAIRASVDAALVRQRQKLNRLMVLLTIAISGGPFLGLLGTVVGVMITFAAIAASGDVNVNSIAPGIAAALVATVAGLVVAIPALFGYNWLGSRIKDIDADTQVFADELINRIAEYYG